MVTARAVNEHLDQGQELGEQQQVRAGRSQQGQQQEEGGVNHVARGHHPQRAPPG